MVQWEYYYNYIDNVLYLWDDVVTDDSRYLHVMY